MAQQFVQLAPHLQQLLRALLLQYRICHLGTVSLPVRLGDFEVTCEIWALHLHGFEDEQRFAKVALGRGEDGVAGGVGEVEAFSLGDVLQAFCHLPSASTPGLSLQLVQTTTRNTKCGQKDLLRHLSAQTPGPASIDSE